VRASVHTPWQLRGCQGALIGGWSGKSALMAAASDAMQTTGSKTSRSAHLPGRQWRSVALKVLHRFWLQ